MTPKRVLALALTLLMMLALFPALLPAAQAAPPVDGCTSAAAPSGKHGWDLKKRDATCEHTGGFVYTCRYCGKEVFERAMAALGHDWSDWTEVERATCTQAGLRSRTCQRCRKSETQPIPALGHTFSNPWTTLREPGCTEAGREVNYCVRCNAEWRRDIAPLGHSWTNWTLKTPPAAESAGTEERSCTRCGAQEERPFDVSSYDGEKLFLTARLVDPKEAYQVGDKVTVECTLFNDTDGGVLFRSARMMIHDTTCKEISAQSPYVKPGQSHTFTIEYTLRDDDVLGDYYHLTIRQEILRLGASVMADDGSYPQVRETQVSLPVSPAAGALRLYAYPVQLPESMTAGNTIRFEAYMRNWSSLHMVDGFIAMEIAGEYSTQSYVTPDMTSPDTLYTRFEHEITPEEEAAGLLTVTFTGRNMPNTDEYMEINAGPVVLSYATGEDASFMIEVSPESRPEGVFAIGTEVRIPMVLRVLSDKPLTLARFVYRDGDAVICDDEMEARDGLKPGQVYHFTYRAQVTGADVLRREGKRTLGVSVRDPENILYNASCSPVFLITKKTDASHAHGFGHWKVAVPPTRKDDGTMERRCLECGYTETEALTASPHFTDGQQGRKVEQLQHILNDLGYKPLSFSGVIDKDFLDAFRDWARDHSWYYEPGLLRPIDIDEVVHEWIDQDEWIAVSAEGTDVNIAFTVTPDREYRYVDDGELLSFTWEAVNLGTEDCRLGPVLVSFGKDNLSNDVQEIYRFVADLDGNTLRAGGGNSLSGSITVAADFAQTQDRVTYDKGTPTERTYGRLTVNARALGTSLATNRKWYSNAWTKTYTVFKTSKTVSPDLVVTAEVLNEKEYYCAGDPLEYRVGLTYTGEIELYGGTLNVLLIGADEQASIYTRFFETLKPGETFSEQTECILGDRFTREDRIELRAEASGLTPEGETVLSEPCCLHVNGYPQRDPDELALVFALEEPGRVYSLGEKVRFTVRLENKTNEPLTDYTIRVSIGNGLYFPTAQEYNGSIVPANGNTVLYTGTLQVPEIYYGDGSAILQAAATACTKDGRPVEAVPLSLAVGVDEKTGSVPAGQLLLKAVQTSPAKAEYDVGDEITFHCELKMVDTETMPGFMSIHVTADDGATVDAVCDGEAFSGSCTGEYTLTLKEKDVTDGCISAVFTGVCAKEAGDPYSHNSNRITYTFPIS